MVRSFHLRLTALQTALCAPAFIDESDPPLLFAWVAVLVLALIPGLAIPARAHAAFPGNNNLIAFEQSSGANQLYTVDPNATTPSLTVTHVPLAIAGDASDPHLSPNGTKIVFTFKPTGSSYHQIYTVDKSGSNLTDLSRTANAEPSAPTEDTQPAWSPDGTKIAFVRSNPPGSTPQIYMMNASDGSEQNRLTNSPDTYRAPAWSPDGEKIAFTRSGVGYLDEIWVMDAVENGAQTRLTMSAGRDLDPDWSPDGTRIAFTRYLFAINVEVVDANGGGGVTPLTGNPTNGCPCSMQPAWSPDGSKLAYVEQVASDQHCCQVNMMGSDGADPVPLTDLDTTPATAHLNPDWQPLTRTSVSETTSAGGTVATNTLPTPNSPVATLVTTPSDGTTRTVTINLVNPPTVSPPSGIRLLPGQANITISVPGSASQPHAITLRWDASLFPAGFDKGRLVMIRNGGVMPDCSGPLGTASPDPCVSSRARLDNGDMEITALTTDASAWNVGVSGYPQPQSAASITMSLVPSFKQCGTGGNAPDARHSPPAPFDVGSCNPPKTTSNQAFAGPNGSGSASLSVTSGDVGLTLNDSDIQTATGSDYDPTPGASGGDLKAIFRIRLTDNDNCSPTPCSSSYNRAGSGTDTDFGPIPVDCEANGSSTASPGSDCNLSTTANTFMPGAVVSGEQAIWQVFRIRVLDGGGTLFQQQGLFAP